MSKDNFYVLIHSPLVGPTTWKLVAEQIQQHGLGVVVPTLTDQPAPNQPYWKLHSQSVSHALAPISKSQPVVLVGHSGAGPLLPAIRQALAHPVSAYVFVDASVPQNGSSRLDLMKSEDMNWANEFKEELERGGHYPTWNFDNLSEIIPDETLRRQMLAEIHPRGLSFFTEPIPVFDGWPDAPCVYILFSAPYQRVAAHAMEVGWPVYELEAGHFHMLVDETAVAKLILEAVKRLG